MGQLLFKKCFFEAIRGGTKRTTLRRWTAPRLKPGGRAWTPGVGWLAIESVDVVQDLGQLTDPDARADGFDSAGEMLRMLKSIYPDHENDGRKWFRVQFRCEAVVKSQSPKPKTPTVEPIESSLAPSRQSRKRASRPCAKPPRPRASIDRS